MNAILTTASIAACLFLAIWEGSWLRRFLPADHLSPDSKDSVKLAMGLVATMAALLLGLYPARIGFHRIPQRNRVSGSAPRWL